MGEEIEIPVPWGHISGKMSGSPSGQVVLGLHGLQDNAGTFDRLFPQLPKGFLYVAIDLPGHGKSSHFERGLPLVYMHYIFSIKLVVDFYKWDTVILIAHSFGAQLSTLFTAFYPERCQKLILLDGLTPKLVTNEGIIKHYRRHFDEMEDAERTIFTKNPPSHTYEEALNRFMNNRISKLTRESAEILIKRSLINSGHGVRFSTDQRLKKLFGYPLNHEQLLTVIRSIKCPCLLIIAKDSCNFLQDRLGLEFYAHLESLDLVQELPNFTLKIVEGNHDVHLNNAPLVARHATKFLLFSKSSL